MKRGKKKKKKDRIYLSLSLNDRGVICWLKDDACKNMRTKTCDRRRKRNRWWWRCNSDVTPYALFRIKTTVADASQSRILNSSDNDKKSRNVNYRGSDCRRVLSWDSFIDCAMCVQLYLSRATYSRSARHIVCNSSAICDALIAVMRKKSIIIRHIQSQSAWNLWSIMLCTTLAHWGRIYCDLAKPLKKRATRVSCFYRQYFYALHCVILK